MSTTDRAGAPVVAVAGRDDEARVQAADVVVARHLSRRAARRWVRQVRLRYPGCSVAVGAHRRGRWCVVGVHGLVVVTTGQAVPRSAAGVAAFGRAVFVAWLCWHAGRRGGRS
jgi:hypothetical protein